MMLLVKHSNTHEAILHFVYGYNHMYENKNFHGKEKNLSQGTGRSLTMSVLFYIYKNI